MFYYYYAGNMYLLHLVLILMIHSFDYYDAACFSGVSNESLSTKVPIYELSVSSYLRFPHIFLTSVSSVGFSVISARNT